jgi:transposase
MQTSRTYPTDLTEQQWQLIARLVPRWNGSGCPPKHSRRHLLNAIFYHLRAGGAWRMLPKDFAPWATVYDYFRQWRPADVERREKRILRQGNNYAVVQIYRYVSEGAFDAYMWQTLETKAKFIAQVMSGDMTIRRLEDLDSAALIYAEVKAIASGNPLVIEKAQVDAELMRLTRLRSAHASKSPTTICVLFVVPSVRPAE